ncbi:MAG: hypothetical protein QXP22_02925 [Candidatus Anstonellales archaeon]
MPRADSAHVLRFSSNIISPRIFEKDEENVPYVFQTFSPLFIEFISNSFINSAVNRIKGTQAFNLLSKQERNAYIERLLILRDIFAENVGLPANEAVVRTFNTIFSLLDIKSRFITFNSVYDVIVDTLQALYEGHGIYFVDVLKAMGEKIALRKFNEEKKLEKLTYEDISNIHPYAVFELLKKRVFHLTVPGFVLAYSVAPTMPHMGGKDWAFYAYPVYKKICDALGIAAYEQLVLNTYGSTLYTAYMTIDSKNVIDLSLWHGFPIIYKDWKTLFEMGITLNFDLTSKLRSK